MVRQKGLFFSEGHAIRSASRESERLCDAAKREFAHATFAQGRRIRRNGRIAQLVEQLTLNQRVLGSNPSASTILH